MKENHFLLAYKIYKKTKTAIAFFCLLYIVIGSWFLRVWTLTPANKLIVLIVLQENTDTQRWRGGSQLASTCPSM